MTRNSYLVICLACILPIHTNCDCSLALPADNKIQHNVPYRNWLVSATRRLGKGRGGEDGHYPFILFPPS